MALMRKTNAKLNPMALYDVFADSATCTVGGVDRIELGRGRDWAFADGTTLTHEQLMERLPGAGVHGSAGDDQLFGSAVNDRLQGAAGHDTLYGQVGQDTYRIGLGMGADTVLEAGGESSRIALDLGVNASDLVARRNGRDLWLGLKGTEDGLTLTNYYADASGPVPTAPWVIDTGTGQGDVNLEIFLANAGTVPAGTLFEQAAAELRNAAQSAYLGQLLSQGYVQGADGYFHHDVLSTSGYSIYSTFTQNLGVQFADLNDNSALINAPSSGVQNTLLSNQTTTKTVPVVDSGALRRVDGTASSASYTPFFVAFGSGISAVKVPFGSTRINVSDPQGNLIGEWIYPPEFFQAGQALLAQAGAVQNRNVSTGDGVTEKDASETRLKWRSTESMTGKPISMRISEAMPPRSFIHKAYSNIPYNLISACRKHEAQNNSRRELTA